LIDRTKHERHEIKHSTGIEYLEFVYDDHGVLGIRDGNGKSIAVSGEGVVLLTDFLMKHSGGMKSKEE